MNPCVLRLPHFKTSKLRGSATQGASNLQTVLREKTRATSRDIAVSALEILEAIA